MKWLLGILVVLMLANVCAVCEDNQVDINSASLEKLDELDGIGPVKAQAIVDYRNSEWFGSVDDLIDVYGIGEVTLQKIKTQGLACVDEKEEDEEVIDEPEQISESSEIEEEVTISSNVKSEKSVELETIKLNAPEPKDIKSEDTLKGTSDKKILDKSDWAKYGFVGFCVLLVFLFILRKPKIQEID